MNWGPDDSRAHRRSLIGKGASRTEGGTTRMEAAFGSGDGDDEATAVVANHKLR